MNLPQPMRIGLIAGVGRYPLLLAASLKKQGHEVYCVAVRDHADPAIFEHCAAHGWMGFGQFGKAIRFLERHHVGVATMAGGINKKLLFKRGFIWRHFPDFYTLRLVGAYMLSNKKSQTNDSILLRCVHAFESRGIHIAAGTDFAPELLVKKSILTTRHPSKNEWKDICYGWQIARQIAGLDIGQSVAIKNESVIAVEALEGTDGCMKRAGELCPAGGFSVIKTAKPAQDMRFDVPFFGMQTIRNVVASGATALAMESDKTIFIDRKDVIDFANKNKITIAILDDDDTAQTEAP